MPSSIRPSTNGTKTVYHGNKTETLIPTYGLGRAYNDFGRGFYTTLSMEAAKEWAWGTYAAGDTGYVHTFELRMQGLNILDFTELDSIHWIAELMYHRKMNLQGKDVVRDNTKLLLDKYKSDTGKYDILIGYPANDSNFAYAEAFVAGAIYKDTLDRALETALNTASEAASETALNNARQARSEPA